MTILNLLIITAIICFIVDISGITDTFKHFLWKKFVKVGDYHQLSIKPFECSLCMTWWLTLLYIILTHHFTIPYIGCCAMLSLLSSNISDLLRWIKDLLVTLTNLLYKLIGQ